MCPDKFFRLASQGSQEGYEGCVCTCGLCWLSFEVEFSCAPGYEKPTRQDGLQIVSKDVETS